ncbi:unnamed protein product [Prunus armeniaca]|uniref:Epidermal patterning factor-like protein n=1 Tax=Prunus armeniaca TaxID=36596 RepID=A0A6J5Y1A2_PRUAR|nr:unnamed protein product [Prunus armeniaca]
MKKYLSLGARTSFLLGIFFMLIVMGRSLRARPHLPLNLQAEIVTGNRVKVRMHLEEGAKKEENMELYPFGSSLPDCSHACGPCFPCKRVMVSFKCSVSESCPIVYRCTCRGKYYHVPSN